MDFVLHEFVSRLQHVTEAVDDPRVTRIVRGLQRPTSAVVGRAGVGRRSVATALRARGIAVESDGDVCVLVVAEVVKPEDIAIARSARNDEFADAVVPSQQLHAVLAEADSLIVTAALTEETQGMIDAHALEAMKPGGVLVNIARGAIVDTTALVDALMSGQLAGAGLDVTDPEPPPPDHPLWTCPNLIVTPHVSGIGSPVVRRRIGALVMDNVDRFVAGRTLRHRVA